MHPGPPGLTWMCPLPPLLCLGISFLRPPPGKAGVGQLGSHPWCHPAHALYPVNVCCIKLEGSHAGGIRTGEALGVGPGEL